MPSRIVYYAIGWASVLAQLRHDSLRGLDGGTVESVSDDVMQTILMKTPDVPILYFSRPAYDEAMQGLSDSESEEAVRKRLNEWSGHALDHALECIAGDERRSLTLTAIAWSAASGDNARALQTHFDSGLNFLSSITGPGRYDDMKFADLLTVVVEAEALLITELGQRSEAQKRTSLASALAQEMTRHGRPAFAQSLPYAEPGRGVWVVPADAALLSYLKSNWKTGVAWRGGAVTDLSTREIGDFQRAGKKIAILYADPGALQQEMNELTNAQLVRRFEQLASAGTEALARQTDDYWNVLRLNIAILSRVLAARAAREDPRVAAVVRPQIGAETQILATELTRTKSWLTPEDRGAPLQRLRIAEDELTADIAFFTAVAERRGDTYHASRMHDLMQRKRGDVERLAAVQGN
jgi:hypothetical protein